MCSANTNSCELCKCRDHRRHTVLRTMSLADQKDAAERQAAYLIAGLAIIVAAVVAIAGLMW